MGRFDKAEPFEGMDIISLLERVGDEEMESDELTRGRIRAIYTQLKYGSRSARNIAEYYSIPIELVLDIGRGRIFKNITSDMEE